MTQSVGQTLKQATVALSRQKFLTPRLDAELILSHNLGCSRTGLLLRDQELLSADQLDGFQRALNRRLAHEPIAYITGVKAFYNSKFLVTNAVLVPRPETELLVEVALEWSKQSGANRPLQILEIGTGSGVIAISLLLELANADIIATDVSRPALRLARKNCQRLCNAEAQERIHFCLADGLGPFAGQRFDIIISNPPYLANAERSQLPPEVVDFEPPAALFAGERGTAMLEQLVTQAPGLLKEPGALIFEFGGGQLRELEAALDSAFAGQTQVHHDLSGTPRCLLARTGDA